jgi:hypothetical protein
MSLGNFLAKSLESFSTGSITFSFKTLVSKVFYETLRSHACIFFVCSLSCLSNITQEETGNTKLNSNFGKCLERSNFLNKASNV